MRNNKSYERFLGNLINISENIFFFNVLCIVLIIPSLIASIFKLFVYICLKLQHGRDFFAMMDGDETIWATQEKSMGQIITLFIQEYNQDDDIVAAFREQIDGNHELKTSCPKLFCRRGYFMGYYYFYHDWSLKLVHEMKDYKDLNGLQKVLCDYGSGQEPLGQHDDEMMVVFVGTVPIKWKTREIHNNKCYPVIVRIHHSLGDGVSLNCLFIKALMKEPTQFLTKSYQDMVKTSRNLPEKQGRILNFIKLMCKKRYAPPFLRRYDENILHGKPLSGRKHLVWNRDFDSQYVQKVKDIKKRLGNESSFNSVIMGAISATFNEYFQQHSELVPKIITSSFVTLPKFPLFQEMATVNAQGIISSIDMTNKYVVCALKVPMTQQQKDFNVIDKVKEIDEEIRKLKDSLDIPILILSNQLIPKLLPVPFVKQLIRRSVNTTFGISNLPGFDRGMLFHGGMIEDLYFWIPNSIKIGIGISIFSSKGRLEMGLIVDDSLIKEYKDVQAFLDRIMYHIDQLDQATKHLLFNRKQ